MKDSPSIAEIISHESIHLRQQLDLLVIFGPILYYLEFIYARWILRLNDREAYYWTSAEQEAHRNATDQDYLKKHRPFAMFQYFIGKKKLSRGPKGELIVEEY